MNALRSSDGDSLHQQRNDQPDIDEYDELEKSFLEVCALLYFENTCLVCYEPSVIFSSGDASDPTIVGTLRTLVPKMIHWGLSSPYTKCLPILHHIIPDLIGARRKCLLG